MGEIFAWLSNIFSALGAFFKSMNEWILSKLYLLVLPFVGVLKLVYDFCRSCVDAVVDMMTSLGTGFSQTSFSVPGVVSFVNAFFPVDEIFLSATLLFTFFCGCQIIATIRGIKQTILF